MTGEERKLVNGKAPYSFYASKIGELYLAWQDKKIDGNTAVKKMKKWYEKGHEKIKKEENADIHQKELKRIFDSLYSFIQEYDLIDDEEATSEKKEPLPALKSLDSLTEGNDPVLRKWKEGKYKCGSLEKFIKAYIKIADNLTPALIRDYLISERTGKQYGDDTIEKSLYLHGLGRK